MGSPERRVTRNKNKYLLICKQCNLQREQQTQQTQAACDVGEVQSPASKHQNKSGIMWKQIETHEYHQHISISHLPANIKLHSI